MMIKKYVGHRKIVQCLFLAIVIGIGIRFTLFVNQIEYGRIPAFERPPGVEAFLPISALVSLKYYLFTGVINGVHPSGLVLFIIICVTALMAKKGFCSWICPVGFVSESLSNLHFLLFKKGLQLPVWLDIPLRSLKYLIAGFFLWSIFYAMPLGSVDQFIHSSYNRFADITMLRFFIPMSLTVLITLLSLLVLSVIIRNVWCRYLCPYGALLSLIGFFSMGKIRRQASSCTQCGRCEKQCQGHIKIREKTRIDSLECTSCLECVAICPEKNAIGFSLFAGKWPVNHLVLGLGFILLFAGGIALAKGTGHWQNDISQAEYLRYGIQSRLSLNPDSPMDPQTMEHMRTIMKQRAAQRSQLSQPLNRKDPDHAHSR